MIARLRRRIRAEDGITLIEMSVASFIGALLSVLMLSWVFAVDSTDDLHRTDDEAMQDLRFAKDEMARDLRSGAVTALGDLSVTLWLDWDHDDVVAAGESVTWRIEAGGELIRHAEGIDPEVILTGLDVDASGFTFDSSDPGAVENVGFDLVVVFSGRGGVPGTRSISSEISLRSDQ